MKEVNKQVEKDPIRPIIRNLKVDESHTYPASRMCVVKSVCSQVSVMENKVFKTKLEKPMFHVSRVK